MIIDNTNIVIDKIDPYYEDAKKYFYKVVDEEIRPLYRIDEDEEVLIINRGLKFLLPKSMLNEVEDYTTNDIDIDVKQDPEFYRNILDGITLRDDQILAVMKCLTHKRGLVVLPTGSGKTIIIAAIIKYYGMMLGYYPTTLIFEPTNYLVNEMIERFNSYGIPATKYSDHRQSIEGITISHPMSLYNDLQKDDELFSEVKIFIGDEIHHQSCNTWSTIYNSLSSIEVSLGFSASIIDQSKIPVVRLSDLTYEEAVIFGCTGNIIMNLPTSYFIKIGVLATPVLFRMSNAASEWVYDDRNWHQLLQKKLESNARTKIVCDCTTLFNILDFKTLIIVSTKRYAEKIVRKLDEYHLREKCVLSYGGGVYLKLDDNGELVDCRDEDPRTKFSNGELNIMIATTHLLEGVDVPNLDVVVLPQIGKKDRRIIQGIGRALRKTKHGHYAYIIDFDDYTSGVLKYQSDTRMKMYKEVIGIKESDIYDHFSLSSMKQVVKRLENI